MTLSVNPRAAGHDPRQADTETETDTDVAVTDVAVTDDISGSGVHTVPTARHPRVEQPGTGAPHAADPTGGDPVAPDPLAQDPHAWHDRALAWERLRATLAAELSVSAMDVTALIELYRHGPLRLNELVAALPIRPPGVTSLVDRLTNARYTLRQASIGDRRGVQVELTPAGRHAAAWVLEQAAAKLPRARSIHADAGSEQSPTVGGGPAVMSASA